MGKTSPEVKKRYHEKTLNITFRLNLEQTNQAKEKVNQAGETPNQTAKRLYLEYLAKN